MSTLAADVTFDFTTFPPCDPTTPPSFTFDPSLLEIPFHHGHARSSSHGSVYSFESSPSDSVAPSTRRTTPARSPIRTHGPLLLPKIRSQDQAFAPCEVAAPAPKRARTAPAPVRAAKNSNFRPSHQRSFTNPEAIPYSAALSFTETDPSNFIFSPMSYAPEPVVEQSRRASSCSLDNVAIEKYGFPTYRQMPTYVPSRTSLSPSPTPQPQSQPQTHLSPTDSFNFQQYAPRASSPLAAAAPITPDMTPSTTLFSYLTAPNPAPSLVRTVNFPLRDPHTRHFWWDVRQIRPWTGFSAASILTLPGASACLSVPVSAALLPTPMSTQRHPETESALHSIYASHYLPKINNALMLCSQRPLQLSIPSKNAAAAVTGNHAGMATDCMFVANVAGESASAATIFGGKPSARIVGLVKSFDRFNTGMRVEGNVKRVEYLRGLAHLHHAMREHGCRYGFIMTEIELVFVRNGAEATPHFGYLEVGSVQLAAASADGDALVGVPADSEQVQLTACLALWGLCMLAGDEPMNGNAHWRADIGAPAEGTRRKAMPRDDWMPQPQLAEKREAKRSRGWVFPEDAIGRKELGKRGVRYGGC
ncbi:hypothetical protein B0H66DRAFT_597243 [Apodospora peruviana]|uniref:Sialidase n=1 Tax=Apodospora peruviana TaxID=516989 RepID=A0AAE0MEK1_9PEZI|nr:hypothetical protein B0H66DRAFT_597243 [Apodospora peruviana]